MLKMDSCPCVCMCIWSKTDEPAAATAAPTAAGHPSQAGHIVGAAGTHFQPLCISHACMIQGESKMVIKKESEITER
jgi:hypothetical protein